MYRKKENSQKRLMAKTIKFSSEEIETITSNAQKKNMYFSDYIRTTALSDIMTKDYYEQKYLSILVPITENINKLNTILKSPHCDIGEIKKIVDSMDKECLNLWQY
jgi:hypothetical protein